MNYKELNQAENNLELEIKNFCSESIRRLFKYYDAPATEPDSAIVSQFIDELKDLHECPTYARELFRGLRYVMKNRGYRMQNSEYKQLCTEITVKLSELGLKQDKIFQSIRNIEKYYANNINPNHNKKLTYFYT